MRYLGGMSNILKYLFNCVLEVVYPRKYECLYCGETIEEGVLCKKCINTSSDVEGEYQIKNIKVYSCKYYSTAFRKIVSEYKTFKNFEVGDYFIELLVDKIKKENIEFDYIFFVPSSNKTIKKRKFDHMKYLADGVAKILEKDVVNILLKNNDIKEQKRLNASEREKNMKVAFEVCKNIDFISGKRVLFIDDVLTTGATLRICKEIVEKTHKIDIILLTVLKSSI